MRPLACLLALITPLSAAVSHRTDALDISVEDDGRITIEHLPAGRTYHTATPPRPPAIGVRRAAAAPTIDGDLADWAGLPALSLRSNMVGDAPDIDGDDDCSAFVKLVWDDDAVCLAVHVRDDHVIFPAEPPAEWWQHDSVEAWFGATQLGFSLGGGRIEARTTARAVPEVTAAMAPAEDGYVVEARVPWSVFAPAPDRQVGAAFRFAVGVNDADAAGARQGQIYFPRTWRHSQVESFATATLTSVDGQAPAAAETEAPVRDLRAVDDGIAWTVARGGQPVAVTLTTPEPESVELSLDLPDHTAAFGGLNYPDPLVTEMSAGHICLAPYADGLLLPQTHPRYADRTFNLAGIDLPFVGLCDLDRGDGYLLLIDTPYDAGVKLTKVVEGEAAEMVPQAVWQPQLGTFGERRTLRYVFSREGDYVGLAKKYRAIAAAQGLLVTLREKREQRPEVDRLAGAPNVWGGDLGWAREAWARGMRRCLLNYTSSRENMQAVNDLGYLTSKYDNYVDLLEEPDEAKWDHVRGPLDHVIVKSDGQLQLGWLTFDKQTQYYKRSSAWMKSMAEKDVPKDLADHPYLGRFLDVTTASTLFEDYHPDRRMTREQDMIARNELFRYVNEQGLVTGGEHGRWWSVPYMDYFEGMMSGGNYSWPAGHLRKPDSIEGISDDYRTYGIGPVYRIPLWELVFGDCAVDYWYWGDSTDILHELDPSITDRKDALNVLYGTPPMYWAGRFGFKRDEEGWRRLMDSYRNTCLWHERVMYEEMLTHDALTDDRRVQQATFSGGFTAVVNLADDDRTVTAAGERVVLPPNGFVAWGPDFLLERRRLDDRIVTRLRAPDYALVDGAGKPLSVPGLLSSERCTAIVESPESIRVPKASSGTINPAALVNGWPDQRQRLLWLSADGEAVEKIRLGREDRIELETGGRQARVVSGSLTAPVDLRVARLEVSPDELVQGHPAEIVARVENLGGTAVDGAVAVLTVDGRPIGEQPVSLPADLGDAIPAASLRFALDTASLDGPRRLGVEVRAADAEPWPADNRLERRVDFRADRRHWPDEPIALAELTATLEVDREVELPLALPDGTDPGTLRVFGVASGLALVGQYEPPEGDQPGRMVWRVPAGTGAGTRFEIVGRGPGSGLLPPGGGFWRAEQTAVETPVYRVDLTGGVPHDIRILAAPIPTTPVISWLTYSSGPTGWVQENGTLESLDLLADGPVRTMVRAKRNLADGTAIVERLYRFYPERMEIVTHAEPSVSGLHARAYYTREADYHDSRQKTTRIDGKGDDEDKISGGAGEPPHWIAVIGDGWANSILPLGKAASVTYWDGGNWGGIGFHQSVGQSENALVFHGPETSPDFAAADAARLAAPPPLKRVE